ncbi:MAG: matrixin family metalloprotease, partial [Planctomycetes bacterium]|nr:matrixin family metalloprotease [Planctomycetota bacterium]
MGIDASKSAIRLRSYLRAKREQFRRMICEGLERRDLMAVFAPGTDESYRAAWEDYFHQRSGGSLGGGGALGINLLGSRWTNPTGGPSPNMGDPARISWSIVPDGTRVGPDSSSLQSSNLIAFMDGLYGTAPGPVGNRPWFKLIKQAYDNWSGLTGVQFVYEPNDDGADYSNTARGVTGVRGDVRIGGNRIDGNFGVLAYNFTPNSGGNSGWDGDMVIDTNDIFYANNSNGPNGENRGLINVLMHESGHGLGLGHVLPVNGTKLMEPNLSLAYLGAQHDDIIGSQTLYGDDYEHNDTNATATNLGTRGNGTIQLNNVSVDRNADADVYRFTITNSGNLAINLSPDGQQYLVGPEGGSATTTDSTRYKDLSFVVEQVGGGVLATVNATGLGASEAIANLALPSEGSYLVRVLGTGSETQLYNLRLTLSGISTSSGGPVDTFRLLSIAPNATEIFSNTRSNVLSESPRELVFRFDADLDRSSLRQGIRIRPAGADKQFTAADSPITPAFLDFGESNRIVIARFSEPLPDDLYQVEVFGVDIPS